MVGKSLEAAANGLVIIAPERVPGDIAELRSTEDGIGVGSAAAVVHAHADDSNGTRHQLRGPGASHPVAGHVSELAVVAGVEPCEQRRFVGPRFAAGDRDLLKAELHTPAPHRVGQRGVVEVGAAVTIGHGNGPTWQRERMRTFANLAILGRYSGKCAGARFRSLSAPVPHHYPFSAFPAKDAT